MLYVTLDIFLLLRYNDLEKMLRFHKKHKRRLYYVTQISRIMEELRNLLILDGHKTARHFRNVGHSRIIQRKRQMLVSQRSFSQNGQDRKYVMQQIRPMGALEKVISR